MVNRQTKRYSTLLINREIQIKFISHLSERLLLKRTQVTNLGENVEKRNPFVLLMRLQTGAATVENSMLGPQIIKYRTAMGSSHHISGCSLEINKIQKQPKSPVVDKWIKKMCTYIHIYIHHGILLSYF